MATVSFDKNIVVSETEAVEKLVNIILSQEKKEINKNLTSPDEMARGEKILKHCLSLSKNC